MSKDAVSVLGTILIQFVLAAAVAVAVQALSSGHELDWPLVRVACFCGGTIASVVYACSHKQPIVIRWLLALEAQVLMGAFGYLFVWILASGLCS